jgi:tetratricopeptide (TPR) repeat protein
LRIAAVLEVFSGNYGSVRGGLQRSLESCREIGDDLNAARALLDFGIILTSEPCFELGHPDEARAVLREALAVFQRLGREREVHLARLHLGVLSLQEGDLAAAEKQLRTALSFGRTGGGNWHVARALTGLGRIALARGRAAVASRYFREAVESGWLLNDQRGRGRSLCFLGDAARAARDGSAAEAAFREALVILQDIGDIAGLAYALAGLAELAVESGHANRSLLLLGALQAVADQAGAPLQESFAHRLEQAKTAATVSLGPANATSAFDEGRNQATERVIAEALRGPWPES